MPIHRLHFSRFHTDLFHLALHSVNLDILTYSILILQYNENPAHQILYNTLRAKGYRQTDYPCTGNDGRH